MWVALSPDSYLIFIGPQAIYDTLLSRRRLRQRLAENSQLEIGLPMQVRIWLVRTFAPF